MQNVGYGSKYFTKHILDSIIKFNILKFYVMVLESISYG